MQPYAMPGATAPPNLASIYMRPFGIRTRGITMKQFAAALLLAVGLTLVGCGSSSSNPNNINGTWNATLTDSNNVQAFTFSTMLVVNSGGSLTISNFTFNS